MEACAINENKCISIAKYDVSAINGNNWISVVMYGCQSDKWK